jgi:hypothetical protein
LLTSISFVFCRTINTGAEKIVSAPVPVMSISTGLRTP